MALGSLEETVEVLGESPVLQTETATVGEVISGTTLQALPLNGRNSGQLSLLLPGVVTPNPTSFTGARNTGGGGRPYVNGNREQTNNYTIDGVDMNESIDNLVAYQPSPDALAEISVETNNYSADTGNVAGAVISSVIKSGSNQFRGNLFEFYRNSKMDANSWSNNRSSAPKPDRTQNIFGGTLGGPLTTIRAHQADVRVDWNRSATDNVFGRFSVSEYESRNDKRAHPLLLGSLTDSPFRNVAFNWNRIFSPSLINEILVGYNQITIVTGALDWANVGSANATFGIGGGQPIPGLSSIRWGSGLTDAGAAATDTNTIDKTYQINQKLTWIKGRHAVKSGGQLLHYVQQRFYAGNNGLLGFFAYGGAFTGFPFSDFLLNQVRDKGRGSNSEPLTHLHNRVALFVQDDFKVTPALTLNLGMRWAYTQPVVEQDNRQSNFDLKTGQQILARDGDRESRSLYRSYKKGFEPRLGF